MKASITNKLLSSIKPQDKPYEIRDSKLKGLMLRVQPTGLMTYYVEYKRGKREKLGRHGAITPFQARELAQEVLLKACSGEDPSLKRKLTRKKSYYEFLESEYKPWLQANLKSPKVTYQRLYSSFSVLKSLRLEEFTPQHLEKWRLAKQQKGTKPTTINRDLADLKAMFTRAYDWKLIASNPIAGVKPCKTESNTVVRFLSNEEEALVREALDKRETKLREARASANEWREERGYPLKTSLENCSYADYLKPVFILSVNTGLRKGEAFSLKWSDIDFELKQLTVQSKNAKSSKTRHVPLNDEVLECLEQWKNQTDSVYLFEGKGGAPMKDTRKSWAKVLKEAQVKDFRWHDLRHTFASKLVMAGVDLNTVRELMGHSDIKMTLRYAHLAPEHKAAAVRRLVA